MNYGLEYMYSGDEAWNNMVERAKEDFLLNSEYQKELLELLNNQIDLAIVIYGRLGNNSIKWIYRKVPMLNNIRPIDCLKNPNRIIRLREALLRMP